MEVLGDGIIHSAWQVYDGNRSNMSKKLPALIAYPQEELGA
ncbi:hypothetical protein ACLBW8_00905 [Pseudomonas sp. M5A4_2d]